MAPEKPQFGARRISWWVPVVLLGTGLILAMDPSPFESPVAPAVVVPAWATDVTPVRQPKLVPQYVVAGYTYACSDCHGSIPSPTETSRPLTQHREIVLEHGINTRCFNCHSRTNRDAFADDAGRDIPWNQPQLLCSKCHGPVYRDWENGAHGRTNGFWDKDRGPQERRKCIECHDPHRPPFISMEPAPGPNTLRMGPQDYSAHGEGHNPLKIGGPASSPGVSHEEHP